MNIKPLADRALVVPAPAEERTIGGIIIPDTAKEKPLKGEVVAVGNGTKDEEMVLKAGDEVLYGKYSGTELEFEGEGLHEKGVCVAVNGNAPQSLVGKTLVAVSEDFYRPTDVVNLWGDPTKARAKLGWDPSKTSFEELVRLMVEHDIAKVAAEGAAAKVRTNLAEYLEKGIVK